MDVLKTFQYVYDKLPGLNPPDFDPEKAGVVLEDGGRVWYGILPASNKGDWRTNGVLRIDDHKTWGERWSELRRRKSVGYTIILDFSKLDPTSIKVEKRSLDVFKIHLETTNREQVISCIKMTTQNQEFVSGWDFYVSTEKDAQHLANAFKHLTILKGGKPSKKDPFDK